MEIIQYQNQYRDDLIYMILDTKDALGRIPKLNEDLLDIEKIYLEKYNFYIIIDKNRVIGSLGYLIEDNIAFLKRFYIKKEYQKQGIGQKLYDFVIKEILEKRIEYIYAHLGQPLNEWIGSYNFYLKNGFSDTQKGYMEKKIK